MRVLEKTILSHMYSMFCILIGLISNIVEWSWAWIAFYYILFCYFFIVVIVCITGKGVLLANKNHISSKRDRIEKLLLVKKTQIIVFFCFYLFGLFFSYFKGILTSYYTVAICLIYSYILVCILGLITSLFSLNMFAEEIKKNKSMIFLWVLTIFPIIDIFILTPLSQQKRSYNYDDQIPLMYKASFEFKTKILCIFVTLMNLFVMWGGGYLAIVSLFVTAIASIILLADISHITRLCVTKI